MRLHAVLISLLLAVPPVSIALEPPPDHGAAGFSKGRAGASADSALKFGNQQVSPDLVAAFKSRLSGRSKGVSVLSSKGLPAEGSPKVLILLIEFEDYPHKAADTAEAMSAKVFGSASTPPYESLNAYYKRSSYGKLNIEGNVLGWYNAGRRADIPVTHEGREKLIERVIKNYPEHNFSQYDNNGDGEIDYFAVIWTGPNTGWGNFWWGYKTEFADKAFLASGKKLGIYSWMYEKRDKWEDAGGEFTLNTLIHETGHALGLPDYYDYKPGVGPNGGLGYLDMMDVTWFDHNCFSKFMLGWIDPEILTPGEFKLRPASEYPECALLAPPGWARNPFSEYFLVENRRQTGNDGDDKFPGAGLVIWHVDARLNPGGSQFLYNNSTTEHKLLKLLESDGLEEIETADKYFFSQNDFYVDGRSLNAGTKPSSALYDGKDTGINFVSRGGDYEAAFSLSMPAEIRPVRGPGDLYSPGPGGADLENITKKVGLVAPSALRF